MENYEEKYNEALKNAKQGKPIEEIFPELKENENENEDERIRKCLLSHFSRYQQDEVFLNNITMGNIVSWLEKQGKVKHTCGNCQTFQDLHQNCPYSPIYKYKDLTETHKHLNDETNCDFWLEKQGEQNYKIIKGKNYFCVKTHNYAGEEWIKGTKYYASDNYTLVNQGCECYCPEYSKEDHNNLFEEVKCDGCVEKPGEQDNNEDSNILQRFSFYSYKDEPNVLYLSGLYVNEECRNKGIGTKILEVADEVANRLNCHTIRLKTESGSDAERLYKENGYNTLKKEGNQVWLEKQGKQMSMKSCAEYYYNESSELNMPEISDFQNELATILMEREYDGPSETEHDIARGRLEYELAAIRLAPRLLSLISTVQQPTEWSEEDEKMLEDTIYLVDCSRCELGKDDSINWLKSLKPNHWKPSEKQMETLGKYVRCTVKDDHEHLEAIYNQLKKLV